MFYVVEIAGRGPGFDVFDRFIPLLTEINIPKLLINNSIGHNVKLKKSKNKQGIIRYFPSKKGKIINIQGFDYLKRIKNVYFKKIAKIGDFTSNANSDGDRLGYIISIEAQKKNAIKRLKQLQKKIKFKYK